MSAVYTQQQVIDFVTLNNDKWDKLHSETRNTLNQTTEVLKETRATLLKTQEELETTRKALEVANRQVGQLQQQKEQLQNQLQNCASLQGLTPEQVVHQKKADLVQNATSTTWTVIATSVGYAAAGGGAPGLVVGALNGLIGWIFTTKS